MGVPGSLVECIGAAQVLVMRRCLGDVIIRIGLYFQLVKVVSENTDDHAIGRFVCAQRSYTGTFEAFV